MYKTVLVRELIQDGEKLLQELDRIRFPITAALWYHDPDRESWRLVVVTELAESHGLREAYLRLRQAIKGLGAMTFDLDDTLVMSPQTRKFQDLRRTIEGVTEMSPPQLRVGLEGAQSEDAYIYRWPR